MHSGADTVYRFAGYELDLAARRLTHDGGVVALQPRVFDLLAFLIAERDRAVDKDAIQDAVWSPAVVSETALTRAIMKARRAVGDDADQQSVIRTVHGHGYQFVAPVDNVVVHEQHLETVRRPTEARPQRRRTLAIASIIVASVVIAALASRAWQRNPQEPETIRIAVLPVANMTGDSQNDYARLGLMSMANDLFADSTTFELVTVADVLGVIQNTGWDGSIVSAADRDKADTLRQAFGATHVLASELETNPGGLRLNFSLLDGTATRSQSTMVSDRSSALVRGMVRSVAIVLGGDRRRDNAETTIIDDDPFINEAYARAFSVALEGRCEEAVPLFDVVLARNSHIVRAHLARADCFYRLGRSPQAQSVYRALLARDDVQEDPHFLATAFRGLGRVLHDAGMHDEAQRAYQDSLRVAETAKDKAAIGPVLISMSILAKDRRDFALARELLARATLNYRQLEWAVLPGQIFSALANIAMNDGKLEEAERHLNDALSSFRGVGDRRNEAMMLNNYGYLRRLQGRFVDAEPLHLRSLEIRRDIGDHVGQGRILGMLSTLYAREGRYGDARDAASQAVSIAKAANHQLSIGTGLAQLGAAERRLGDLGAAREAYEASGEIFTNIDDVSRAAQVTLRLADIDLLLDDEDSAAARISNVLTLAQAEDLPEPEIEALLRQGDMFRRREQPLQAIDAYERAMHRVRDSGVASAQTVLAIKLATLYLDTEDTRAAEPLLGHIVEQEQTLDTLRIRARYAISDDDPAHALSLMDSAKKVAGDAWSEQDESLLQAYSQAALGENAND